MTPSELLELAGIVEPDKEWCRPILPGHPDYGDGKDTEADYVAYFDFDGPEDLEIRFNPSLTGEDWQKAQALDCIMAALSKYWLGEKAYPKEEGKGFYFYFGSDFKTEASDLLTASAMALLADRGKG